jgi:hypothetical protein
MRDRLLVLLIVGAMTLVGCSSHSASTSPTTSVAPAVLLNEQNARDACTDMVKNNLSPHQAAAKMLHDYPKTTTFLTLAQLEAYLDAAAAAYCPEVRR